MTTYVFDASALVAYLLDRPGSAKVKELLKEAVRGRSEIFMSAVNFGEVYVLVLREHGVDRARAILSAVQQLRMRFVDATVQRCLQAASLKTTYKLYYADSFAAALAVEHKATLVTSDSDFRRLGHKFPVLWLRH